jgi:hypothetical protein
MANYSDIKKSLNSLCGTSGCQENQRFSGTEMQHPKGCGFNRISDIKDFLFGSLDQLMINVFPEKVDKAEAIFQTYAAKQISKKNVSHYAEPFCSVIELDSEEPDKVMLIYLVESKDRPSLFEELVRNDIAGYSRHNPVFSRPYSLGRRIAFALDFRRHK